MESKIRHKRIFLQNRNRHTGIENRLGVAKGEVWTGSLGLVDANYSILEWIKNETLLYSTGKYIQSPGTDHDGEEYLKKERTYMYD